MWWWRRGWRWTYKGYNIMLIPAHWRRSSSSKSRKIMYKPSRSDEENWYWAFALSRCVYLIFRLVLIIKSSSAHHIISKSSIQTSSSFFFQCWYLPPKEEHCAFSSFPSDEEDHHISLMMTIWWHSQECVIFFSGEWCGRRCDAPVLLLYIKIQSNFLFAKKSLSFCRWISHSLYIVS